jgi:hypothetical protein
MQSRFHSGWKALVLVAAIAALALLPVTGAVAGGVGLAAKSSEQTQVGIQAPQDGLKQPTLYPRSTYMWRFGSGPTYGDVDPADWARPYVLHTAVGSFDLTRGLPSFPDELRASVSLTGNTQHYYYLQVHPDALGNGSFEGIRGMIQGSGGAVMSEMANAAFLVRTTETAAAQMRNMPGVFVEPYHPAFKLAANIGRAPLPDPLRAVSDVYTVDVKLFRGEPAENVVAAVAALGGNVTLNTGENLVVELHRDKLPALAKIEAVEMVQERLPVFVKGEETTTTMQTGAWNSGAVPYFLAGVNGGGCTSCVAAVSAQILMVLDAGFSLDAADLSDTRTNGGFDNSTASKTCTDAVGGCDGAGRPHRKVRLYSTVNTWGGTGDLSSCDSSISGGSTHGHIVAGTALGNATNVETFYGAGWTKTDTGGNPWKLDGVAMRGLLLGYDAQVTPTVGGCDDPGNSGLLVGTCYNGASTSSMKDAYDRGARTVNFSWGTTNNHVYGGGTSGANAVDSFLFDKKDAMVFLSAGNEAIDQDNDGFDDPNTVSDPATAKNAVVVGASGTANDTGGGAGPRSRAGFSSVGPATAASQRIAPIVMAPGTDFGGMGLTSEFVCRSLDNDQTNPVQCDVIQGNVGTSFASPAAAGANMLIRDYFAKGFFPDGTNANPGNDSDKVTNLSGALSKALVVASAEWLSNVNPLPPSNLHFEFRPNNEQGFGRIQLNNVLPLATYPSPLGLAVTDGGGVVGAPNNLGLDGTIGVVNETDSTTFNVCDRTQALKVSLAWVESAGDTLAHNLNLEIQSPAGRIYYGNYTTDDDDKDGILDAGENCDYSVAVPWPPPSTNLIDTSHFSIPTCVNSDRDTKNPVEGIFLSPDPQGDGITDDPDTTTIDEGADNQLEVGNWTIRVIGATIPSSQGYAAVVAGPVCLGSSARIGIVASTGDLLTGNFTCNDKAVVTINEVSETGDVAPTTTQVSARTTVQVIDPGTNKLFESGLGSGLSGDDVLKDTETGLNFTATGLRFDSDPLTLTNGTAPDPGNGALDVQDGQYLKVIYADVGSTGLPDPNKVRTSSSLVDCKTAIVSGGVTFGTYGRDAFALVSGGCDKDARGLFTFGFPDKYMDHGELVGYRIAFESGEETIDLVDTQVSLKAVATDADSPASCKPGTTDCADPNRTNNPLSAFITVLDSPKIIGLIPPGNSVAVNFAVQVSSGPIPALTPVDMVLGVSAKKSGRAVEAFVVSRHTLDVDESSIFYSTDFPTGGTETRDKNNNETIENPTTDPEDVGGFTGSDYYFETRTYSDLTATGTNSTATLRSPWNFDSNNGGFTVVLNNITTKNIATTLAQWGEDKNGNGVLDGGEDRDPANGVLDNNWGTRGGCGWQSRIGTGSTGCDATNRCGMWHTGRVDTLTITTCLGNGLQVAACQRYEALVGTNLTNQWFEILMTPIMHKVNQCVTGSEGQCAGRVDTADEKVFTVEFTDFAFNALVDINDSVTALTMELDNDADQAEPADLVNDATLTQTPLFGPQGAIAGGNAPITNGFPLFANIGHCVDRDQNGTNDHCSNPPYSSCTSNDSPCSGVSSNGTAGGNRVARNNCFFEGKGTGTAANFVKALDPYGLPKPVDDDQRNGFCANTLDAADKSKMCINNTFCASLGSPYATTCTFTGTSTIDQFVVGNGPVRNYDLSAVNGPDLRFTTVEDIQEDSGTSFQAGLGFYASEGSQFQQPHFSYGVGADDVVIAWREFKLVPESANDCTTNGQCADVEMSSNNLYEGNALVNITVTDPVPYSIANPKNDCNSDGDFTDAGLHCWNLSKNSGSNAVCSTVGAACAAAGEFCFSADDTDCDDNGTLDVTIKVTSEAEPTGEIVVLNRTTVVGSGGVYRGSLPISMAYNSFGVLFLNQQGGNAPTITANYFDRNILAGGPDTICPNDQDLGRRGTVVATTSVFVPAGKLILKGVRLVDNGDGDAFADTNETVQAFVTLINKSTLDLDDVKLGLVTTSTQIDCISRPFVDLGSMAAVDNPQTNGVDEREKETPIPFLFHVGSNVNRTNVNDLLQATFSITATSEKFDVLTRDTTFTIDLDYSASGGGSPTTYSEGFESGTFGTFTSMSLDEGKASNTLSNGFRCQYNDPDGPNSNQGGRTTCFLGFTNAAGNAFDWHIHTTASPDGGRAYDGTRSLHLGVHPGAASADTTRLSQLDAIRTTAPIYLGAFSGASPQLSYKHQVSLVDNRTVNIPFPNFAADRAVAQYQFADSSDNPLGNWVKLFPYQNEYDAQGVDNYTNCTFDPTDDGNNEDSFFDPTDPNRRTGPSSTCFPEFSYAFQGDIFYQHAPGDMTQIGRASDGPGLRGSIDRGTWIEPKYNLSTLVGRRMRLRFLFTSIEVNPAVLVTDALGADPDNPGDDGWYVDNIVMTDTLTSPATILSDATNNNGLPACANCTTITASLVADDTQLDAPGQVVELDASGSTADFCSSGVLQFRFWEDLFSDGVLTLGVDPLLRDWLDNPILLDAPDGNIRYAVQVRCSSNLACGTPAAFVTVGVTCPGLGGDLDPGPFSQTVNVGKGTSPTINLTWTSSSLVDAIRGNLNTLRSTSGNFTGAIEACIANNTSTNSVADSTVLSAGLGKFYLVRRADVQCNEQGTWSTETASEVPGRNTETNLDSDTCP